VVKNIIVDGSNIATEGRSAPSLAQLNEAVIALMREYPSAKVSVVVDATFGHRIARKEVAEFNKAIEHNELVAPPAGAVGRGDAFVLAIADKVNASILSNDSYQEFHGKFKWLFDPGRLIGGKPVPHVGWVFVERLPVRGPVSRRSTKEGKVVAKVPHASAEASKPLPVPKSPPPNAAPPASRSTMANEVMPYLQFVEKHKVGTKVKATVAEYTSNGATVAIGDVRGYLSLKHMASPPPRAAREVLKIGDAVQLVIVGYTPARRSVDLAVPGVEPVAKPGTAAPSAAKKPATKKVAAKDESAKKVASRPAATKSTAKKPVDKSQAAKKTAVKKPATKTAAAKKAAAAKAVPAKKAPAAKKTAAKKTVGRSAAKKTAAKKA
jgi:predicted RNA-binding protein with RPS1 domain